METGNNKLTFWSRPEGTTGKILLGLLFAVGAWAFVHFEILTLLIAMATNTLHLMFLVGFIGAILYTVTAERPRTLLRYGLEMASKQITSIFVNIDPVSILSAFVKSMRKKQEVVAQSITQMRAARAKMKQARDKAQHEMEDFVSKARIAQQRGDQENLALFNQKAGRRDKAIAVYDANLQTTDAALSAMERVSKIIEYHIDDSQDQLDQLRSDNESAELMLQAMAAAKGALGDSDEADVRDMAIQVIQDKVAHASAEVDQLMQSTKTLQGKMDYDKLTFEADGAAQLAALEKRLNKAEATQQPKMLPAGATSSPLITSVQPDTVWANRLNKKAQ